MLPNSLSHLLRGKVQVEMANLEQALRDLSNVIESLETARDGQMFYFGPVEQKALTQAQELRADVEMRLGRPAEPADFVPQPQADREANPLEDNVEDTAPRPPAPVADPTAWQWEPRSTTGNNFVT